MWKTLAMAGLSLALTMPIALAQSASPAPKGLPSNMSVAPGNGPAVPQYPGVIGCTLCTTCGSYWPYTAGYYYTVNVNYGGQYTRANACTNSWAWRTGITRLCCSVDYQ